MCLRFILCFEIVSLEMETLYVNLLIVLIFEN
jgi:hypothetical protein